MVNLYMIFMLNLSLFQLLEHYSSMHLALYFDLTYKKLVILLVLLNNYLLNYYSYTKYIIKKIGCSFSFLCDDYFIFLNKKTFKGFITIPSK